MILTLEDETRFANGVKMLGAQKRYRRELRAPVLLMEGGGGAGGQRGERPGAAGGPTSLERGIVCLGLLGNLQRRSEANNSYSDRVTSSCPAPQ